MYGRSSVRARKLYHGFRIAFCHRERGTYTTVELLLYPCRGAAPAVARARSRAVTVSAQPWIRYILAAAGPLVRPLTGLGTVSGRRPRGGPIRMLFTLATGGGTSEPTKVGYFGVKSTKVPREQMGTKPANVGRLQPLGVTTLLTYVGSAQRRPPPPPPPRSSLPPWADQSC